GCRARSVVDHGILTETAARSQTVEADATGSLSSTPRSLRQVDLDLSLEDDVQTVGRTAFRQDQLLRLAQDELRRREHRIEIGGAQALEDDGSCQDRPIVIE